MKLERLSENQIRCTLNKADLADRELMLNELAYGTDKAKELFRDMMEQAAEELGFEANDIPLMIEAIPISPDCLILIITKVEDPEELDTRFSRFSKYTDIEIDDDDDSYESDSYFDNFDNNDDQSNDEDDDLNISDNHKKKTSDHNNDGFSLLDSTSSLLDTLSNIVENIEQVKKQNESGNNAGFIPLSASLRENAESKSSNDQPTNNMNTKNSNKNSDKTSKKNGATAISYRIFSFQNINDISKAASMVSAIYRDENTLYKSPIDNLYYLIVKNQSGDTESYQRTCNLLSEYGTNVKGNYAMPYYFSEHFTLIIKKDAIQTLAGI